MLILEVLLPVANFAAAEGGRLFGDDVLLNRLDELLAGGGQGVNALHEMVHGLADGGRAVEDVIFIALREHAGLVEPAQVRLEALADIGKIHRLAIWPHGIGQAQDAGAQALVEVGQYLSIVFVVNVFCEAVGDVKNVRDDHVARVAIHEIGQVARLAGSLDGFGPGVKVSGGNVAGAQRVQKAYGILAAARQAGFGIKGGKDIE